MHSTYGQVESLTLITRDVQGLVVEKFARFYRAKGDNLLDGCRASDLAPLIVSSKVLEPVIAGSSLAVSPPPWATHRPSRGVQRAFRAASIQ
jgi:hypothetical protein